MPFNDTTLSVVLTEIIKILFEYLCAEIWVNIVLIFQIVPFTPTQPEKNYEMFCLLLCNRMIREQTEAKMTL